MNRRNFNKSILALPAILTLPANTTYNYVCCEELPKELVITPNMNLQKGKIEPLMWDFELIYSDSKVTYELFDVNYYRLEKPQFEILGKIDSVLVTILFNIYGFQGKINQVSYQKK